MPINDSFIRVVRKKTVPWVSNDLCTVSYKRVVSGDYIRVHEIEEPPDSDIPSEGSNHNN